MLVRELMDQLKKAPPEAVLCVAEVDEAFAANAASVELVEDAKIADRSADGSEAVELGKGRDKAVETIATEMQKQYPDRGRLTGAVRAAYAEAP